MLLSGCAHTAQQRPAFDCTDEIATDKRRVMTTRYLDKAGRQLRLQSNWFEHGTVASAVSVGAGWFAQAGEPVIEDTDVSLIYDAVPGKAMKRVGGVELRWGSPSNRANDPRLINRKRVNLSVFPPWPLLQQLFASRQPLYLVMIDRQERVLRSERIDPAIFERGLFDVRTTITNSAAKARDPTRLCAPYEEIIVT